ncbi:RNA polymerase II transcriptional coactivator [Musa troglodytarum]|uniref:RNA polymerase II transcriptional coactivator n=1 Tax=Musa troglodytarum TaxID=320322 RepID=A0A9E7L7S0_9LILI|nr:RNA polymerase II transcriptional coactivator [Musa troglodytarum]
MDEETKRQIEETVLEILRDADMTSTTEFKVRSLAAERLGIDLSHPDRKLFVRGVVESFLVSQNSNDGHDDGKSDPGQEQQEEVAVEQPEQDREEEEEEAEDEDEGAKKRRRGPKEYNDDGDLIICRLSSKRRVTLRDFRGKTLLSIREYYMKDGKELPSSKGISLTVEQWEAFRDAVPAIEAAIKKLEGSD